jgi:hypothetical protein
MGERMLKTTGFNSLLCLRLLLFGVKMVFYCKGLGENAGQP